MYVSKKKKKKKQKHLRQCNSKRHIVAKSTIEGNLKKWQKYESPHILVGMYMYIYVCIIACLYVCINSHASTHIPNFC